MTTPQLFTMVEGKMHLHPHKYQCYTMESQKRLVFMLKGMQGGATSLMPHLAIQEMRRCGPGNRALTYLGITPTLQVARNKLIPEFQRVFCDLLGLGVYKQAPKPLIEITPAGEMQLWGERQKEPTQIVFCYAADPDSFAGYTALGAFGDEIGQKAFKRSAWMELMARLSTPSGMMAPNNPPGWEGVKMGRFVGGSTVYELNWIEDLYNEWERSGGDHPMLDFIRFDSTANPAFPREQWELAKATLPDWLFDMRYRALFRRPAGIIFEGWDPKVHVIQGSENFNPKMLPSSFTYGAGIDFGKRNFYASIIAHDTHRDRFFLFRMYHRTDLSTAQHADELLRIAHDSGFYFDNQSVVAGQISEDSDRQQMASAGLMSLPPAYKDLWPGINNFNALLRMRVGSGGKFNIFDGVSKQFEDEMRTYSRPVDEMGNVQLDKDPEDKDTYHTIDTVRYYFTRKFNPLLATSAELRAGGEKTSTMVQEKPVPPAFAPPLRSGGGLSRAGRMRQKRYGFDEGCTQPHLDIRVR